MNTRTLLCAVALGAISTPALATEYATGFVAGTGVTLESPWTQGAGYIQGTNVVAKRAYRAESGIVKSKDYLVSITVTNWTQGEIQVALGSIKSSLIPGAEVAPTIGGATAIPDNFNVMSTLSGSPAQPDSPDPTAAMRFVGGVAKFIKDDPMLYPCKPGAAHLHMVWGNKNFNSCSNYRSLRTSGDSTLGKANRSAYWVPAMLNGNGNVMVPYYSNFYYKGYPSSSPQCGAMPSASKVGFCVGLPNNLRFVAGHNMAFPTSSGVMSSIATEAAAMHFECRQENNDTQRDTTANGTYDNLEDMVDAGCPANSVVYQLIEAPSCWDGVNLDSADHRSHMAYFQPGVSTTIASGPFAGSVIGRCPTTHPYNIPHFSIQIQWKTRGDPTFLQKKWKLSSDEQMNPRMKNGMTMHMDYWEAWSPTVKALWDAYCRNQFPPVSCSAGAVSIDKRIRILGYSGANAGNYRSIASRKLGWTGPITGNGTFTMRVRAIDGGQIGIYSAEGFSGRVTAISVTDAP